MKHDEALERAALAAYDADPILMEVRRPTTEHDVRYERVTVPIPWAQVLADAERGDGVCATHVARVRRVAAASVSAYESARAQAPDPAKMVERNLSADTLEESAP